MDVPAEADAPAQLVYSLRGACFDWDNTALRANEETRIPVTCGDIRAACDLIDRYKATLEAMRARDDRNGSLPLWYREQLDAALDP